MNVLFISYWGINDGLTQSTVIPNLRILSQYNSINKIILVTIERGKVPISEFLSDTIEHIPIRSKSNSILFIRKILDFMIIPKSINKICKDFQINKIIARGSPGGAIAYKISKNTGIPFYVESFEPHADYMKESGVWKKWSLKFFFQKRWEKKQFQNASGIMTVSEGYTNFLNNRFHHEIKVRTVPCAVNLSDFKYNSTDRSTIRKDLGISEDQICGIYVGKFGGLYMDIDQLDILKTLFEHYPDLYFIILTSNPENKIRNKLSPILNIKQKLWIRQVQHNDVAKYLSASDFAISLVKPFASAKFTSPIKHGEYWANGLPVLMTEGIGDERNFLEREKGGVLFNENNLLPSLKKLKKILDDPEHRQKISELARKYRSFDKVKEAYEKMIISSEK